MNKKYLHICLAVLSLVFCAAASAQDIGGGYTCSNDTIIKKNKLVKLSNAKKAIQKKIAAVSGSNKAAKKKKAALKAIKANLTSCTKGTLEDAEQPSGGSKAGTIEVHTFVHPPDVDNKVYFSVSTLALLDETDFPLNTKLCVEFDQTSMPIPDFFKTGNPSKDIFETEADEVCHASGFIASGKAPLQFCAIPGKVVVNLFPSFSGPSDSCYEDSEGSHCGAGSIHSYMAAGVAGYSFTVRKPTADKPCKKPDWY